MPTKSKQPAQHLDPDAIYRAKWTAAKRKAYLKAHPENCAGPDGSFPIEDASDVGDAWNLAGHADNPDAVRSKIKEIAKRLGLESGLPETAKEDKVTTGRADAPDGTVPDDPLDDILDTEDDEYADEDEHNLGDVDSADCDEDEEDRGQAEVDIVRATAMPAPDVSYYAPITRIDKEKREVIGTATAEIKDAYRTVIGYDASKDALQRWRGNVREMHDPTKAVGRALEVRPDDDHKRIIVRARISKGAQDTWEKVLDGTLTGFSIGGKNGVWTKRVIDGEELPYLERYDAVELSLVDNPACPGCNIEVVRADGFASDILAKDEEMEPKNPEIARTPGGDAAAPPESIERAGARLSKETMDAMHMARDHAKNALSQTCQTCGCDDCQSYSDALMAIGEHDDNDGDIDANFLAQPAMRRLVGDIVRAEIADALRTQLAPTMQRINALMAADASRAENPDITRRVDGIDEQLSAIKDLVEKIAAQPVDGGPVLHGGPGAPMDKRLALQGGDRRADDAEILRRALEMGFTPPSTQEAQVLAAAKLVRR